MYPTGGNPQRVLSVNRGYGYSLAVQSGTIAAALAQDSIVFALKVGPSPNTKSVNFERLLKAFQTIVAFTTPITAGRRLGIYRATNAGAEVSGGTDVTAAIRKKDADASVPATAVSLALIATTAGLTAGGLVREANPLALIDLTDVGAAGARRAQLHELAPPQSHEWCFNPGEYIVVSNPVAMDAAGTWQLTVNELSWIEQARTARALS